MRYLLDTNICIYLIKKRPHRVLEKFNAYSVGEIGVSSITVWIHSKPSLPDP
jgi:tRNA(fMet)-specific endonuclease VapC